VVTPGLHDFFVAGASAGGALIGLLFVVVTVAGEKMAPTAKGLIHRIRAAGALTAFTNALVISLFALIPGSIGWTAVWVAVAGLLFVSASLLALYRLGHVRWRSFRDAFFLFGLIAVFVNQLVSGLEVLHNPRNLSAVDTIAVLVGACFLIGIDRSWELAGGPSIGLNKELIALVRERRHAAEDDPGEPAP
jgi:hypothetical protein